MVEVLECRHCTTEEIGKEHSRGQLGSGERGLHNFLGQGKGGDWEVPFVYRPNLIAAIADLVERHETYNIR